jgi:hypothetical protein
VTYLTIVKTSFVSLVMSGCDHSFLVLLFTCSHSFSQQGFFCEERISQKRTYTEGDVLHVKLADGSYLKGVITLLRNDTIFINGSEPYWSLKCCRKKTKDATADPKPH